MSRSSRNNSAPEPSPAFNGYQTSLIRDAINRVARKQMAMFVQPFMHNDLLQLFVPAEIRDTVRQAWLHTHKNAAAQTLQVSTYNNSAVAGNDRVQCAMSWYANVEDAFYVPNDQVDFVADAPHEQMLAFREMISEIQRVSFEFGCVLNTFNSLNTNCRTPAQMRYVWPTILPICKWADMDSVANEIAAPSSRAGHNAQVPAGIGQLIRPTYETVARALLIPTDLDVVELPFRLELMHNEFSMIGVVVAGVSVA